MQFYISNTYGDREVKVQSTKFRSASSRVPFTQNKFLHLKCEMQGSGMGKSNVYGPFTPGTTHIAGFTYYWISIFIVGMIFFPADE